jgi:hypothetical protein
MSDFSPQVAGIAGDVPVALLPVRIEARFFDNGRELRVRIFPDQIHIDAHEPELTATELEAGEAYWRAQVAGEAGAWEALCAAVRGPARAAWVSQALEPTNLGQPGQPHFPVVEERPAAWSKAAVATALPERWVVIGQRTGTELFRVWTNAVADGLDVTLAPLDDSTPVPDGELPLQPSARWLVDFEEAERVGMAVRVSGAQLDAGLDRLFVLGVDWTLAPDAAADTINDLLAAHVYTDGLEALAPGTPTNVTAAARSGAPPSADALAAALDPEHRPSAQAARGTGADRTWRALGLESGGLLSAIPGALGRDQELASHLTNALWESTLGLYLADFMNPNFTDAAAAQVREHARHHLFPGGPFATLRIGRQPYGVLPVVAPGRFTPADGALEAQLATVLGRLRTHWEAGVSRAPHLARTADLDADLTAVLQTTPAAATLRYRNVVGPLTISATLGLEHHAAVQERVADLLGTRLGWPQRPFVARCGTQPADQPLRVPLVDPVPPAPGAGLSRNYLQEIVKLARTSGTYEAIQAREDADTLLEALVAHAVARELHRADLRVIDLHLLQAGQVTETPKISVTQTAEFVGIEATGRPPGAPGALVTTPFEAARLKLGQKTVRQSVTELIRPGASVPVRFPELAGALASLEWLSNRPAEELDRGFRGLLDAYAYRLDAWLTSLATRRLADVRTARPAGVHLGGYGWLDDLRPDAGAPTSEGFVHAPSLPQAATAAVLRSGRLAHHDGEHAALDIDLRSDRVRLALGLLEGVSVGQPLAGLLGYRFERALREHSVLLAKYILPLRRMFPLRTDGEGDGSGPVEAIAARDVVDGVTLLDRWRTQRDGVLNRLTPSPPAADRQGLVAELDRLADLYDAVSDVMVAEAVHQNVLGNNERAGAVLAALDRQGLPPRMDFVRTPRTGKTFAHRVLVLAGDEAVPAGWMKDALAAAEPRLNAWIARIVGAPGRVRFAATATGVAQELTATLAELRLSPVSLVMAAHAAGHGEPSELEERLIALFAGQLTAPTPETELVLLEEAPAGSRPEVVGLGALRALLRRVYELITDARPADAADLALPADAGERGLDDAQLKARADALATAFAQALTKLENATTAAALRGALWGAAEFGVAGSVPPLEPHGGGDDHAELAAQAAEVATRMHSALAAADAVAAGASVPERVAQHTARIGALLGEHFPVLPRFTVANAAQLRIPRAELLAGDPLAPSAWLGRMALVRDGVERLARVRHGAELLDGDVRPDDLVLAQLPHVAGERWLALESPDAAEAELSIVAHTSGTVDFCAPLAGLFCDGWSETIPDRDETTGIAFHHDAPGARPPQAVLLAVPPAAVNPEWSVDALLDTVIEAHDLARIRAVGPRQLDWLGTLLPMLYLPEAFSKDVPTIDIRGLVQKYKAANAATATILGKG